VNSALSGVSRPSSYNYKPPLAGSGSETGVAGVAQP